MNRSEPTTDLKVLEPLGVGGTAQVTKVYSPQLNRYYALKAPKENSHLALSDFIKLINREFTLIGNMRYPGLVRLIKSDTGASPFLLMELCQGPTLDSLGRLDNLPLALSIISSVAINIEFIRLAELAHGDLKPHNIFLPSDYQSLKPNDFFYSKISDFSLSKLTGENDQSRAGLGTIGYMPPETIETKSINHRSDLFALGIIAYELLSGVHPFAEDETDPVKISSRIKEVDPEPLSKFRGDLPEEIITLVNRLLAKKPDQRPESAWQVCLELEKAGCLYPFRKALKPRYLLKNNDENNHQLSWLNLDDKQIKRLNDLTSGDPAHLQLVLSFNHNKEILQYNGTSFVVNNHLQWPSLLRRFWLHRFKGLSQTEKRKLIENSILAVTDLECPADDNYPFEFNHLLISLLHPSTVRRTAGRLTQGKTEDNQSIQASALYIMAADLESAAEKSFQAANILINKHQPIEAINLLNRVIELADLKSKTVEIRQLLMLQADTYKSIGELEKSEAVCQRILKMYESIESDKLLAETYKDLGDIYRTKNNFEAGLKYLEKALKIYDDLGDELERSRTYNNIGSIYTTTSNLTLALKNYRQALRIKRRINDAYDLGQTVNNIGIIFGARGKYKRAKNIFEISLGLNRQSGRKVEIARTLNNLGYTYFYSGELDKSTECLIEAFKINEEIGTKKELLYNYENLTSVMIISGRLQQAEKHLKEAMILAGQLGDKTHLAEFAIEQASINRRLGNFTAAETALNEADTLLKDLDAADQKTRYIIEACTIALYLNDLTKARKLAEAALELTANGNNVPARLASLLLMTRITGDEQYFNSADEIIDKLNLYREKQILSFNRLEHVLSDERPLKKFQDIITRADLSKDSKSDIEYGRHCNIVCQLKEKLGDSRKALELSHLAVEHSKRTGQKVELIKSLANHGRLCKKTGDHENAFRSCREALEAAKQVLATVSSEEQRLTFQSDKTLQMLVGEIKELGQMLSKSR